MKRNIFLCLIAMASLHASSDEDWRVIVAMDSGPAKQPKTLDQAQSFARAHIAKNRELLEAFVRDHAADPRVFDARLRLTSILATTGKMDKKQSLVDEAMRVFQALEKDSSAPVEKRADAGFRRVCLFMQSQSGLESENRRDIVAAAKNFQARYPADRRTPRLLVEVATICDNDPDLKRKLLEEARGISKEEPLNRRIADDLKRLDLIGKPLPLHFQTVQGGSFDIKDCKGSIVFLIFWSGASAPSLLWIEDFRLALAKMPRARFEVVTLSLDKDPSIPLDRIKELGISTWPTGCDGQGWSGAVARQCGINSLPTVFLIDQHGVLRATNVRMSYESWIRKLLIQPTG
jgi:hypothetical protein